MGSGTTLVQCLELGLHSIGIDISKFNCMISEVKVQKYDLDKLGEELHNAVNATEKFSKNMFWFEPEADIDQLCSSFNKKYYPNPEFKIFLGVIREYQSKIESEINTLLTGDHKNRQKLVEKALRHHKDEIFTLEKEIASFMNRNFAQIQFKIN